MRLIIFDLDDTLTDNTKLDLDSFSHISDLFGLKKIPDSTIIKWRKHGMLSNTILKNLIQDIDIPLKTCIEKRLQYLKNGGGGIKLINEKFKAYETLKKLSDNGFTLVVCTSRTNLPFIKKIFKKLRFNDFIDEIFSSVDYEKTTNTFPQNNFILKHFLYKLILEKYISDRKNKPLVIGNMTSDIYPAKQLQINHLGIKGSYRFDFGMKKITKTIDCLENIFLLI